MRQLFLVATAARLAFAAKCGNHTRWKRALRPRALKVTCAVHVRPCDEPSLPIRELYKQQNCCSSTSRSISTEHPIMAPLSLSQVYAHQREISNAIAGKHAGSGLYSPRPQGAIAKPPRAAAKTKAFQHRLLMLENNAGKQRFLADTRSSSSASSTSPVSSTDIACRSTIDSLLSSDATEGELLDASPKSRVTEGGRRTWPATGRIQ